MPNECICAVKGREREREEKTKYTSSETRNNSKRREKGTNEEKIKQLAGWKKIASRGKEKEKKCKMTILTFIVDQEERERVDGTETSHNLLSNGPCEVSAVHSSVNSAA